jgi:hypothetical protein
MGWGIKKWPARILQGALAGAQVVNAGAVLYPPLLPVAIGLGVLQVSVGVWQHKSTEEGEPVPPPNVERRRHNDERYEP